MAKPSELRELTAWGRSSSARVRFHAPTDTSAIAVTLLGAGTRGIIARGLARSYGDASLNDGGDVVGLTACAQVLDFDSERGVVTAEAGVSFAQLMRITLPQGWLLRNCPGTAFVTLGGALANDVHGKNQHITGSFADHVLWFDLITPEGAHVRVDPVDNPILFEATAGGIGLTGVIVAMAVRLERVPSNAMTVREERISDIDRFLERLVDAEREHPYVVGWIDAAGGGRRLGRGILECAGYADRNVGGPGSWRIPVPFDFPRLIFNRYSVAAFNSLYFHRVPRAGRDRSLHIERFLYPLDALTDWNRMYGRPGVYQFQCVVPHAEGRRAIIELLETIVASHAASFLAVLKSMGRHARGMLSFPMPGFTLALDFPRRAATRALVYRLQDIAMRHGGRVYLAKDACMRPADIRAMYPRLEEFLAARATLDPHNRMQSDMARRLGLLS